MFSIRIILLFIVGVTANNMYEKCIYFDRDSGFVALSPLEYGNPVKIRMDVKAYNCDDISVTMNIGRIFKFMTPVQGTFITISSDIRNYKIDNPCNGLWHNVGLDLYERTPLFNWGDQTYYSNKKVYDLNKMRGETIYIGFHNYIDVDTRSRSYVKPFEGYIRNITIDGVPQSMDQSQLNGTLLSRDCPTDVIFTTAAAAVKLNRDVSFDSRDFKISFELKIANCPECCSRSAIIMSAIADDSYFILEIVQNELQWKVKTGLHSEQNSLSRSGDGGSLCDGKWHKIAVLQQIQKHKLIADNHSDTGVDRTLNYNFTAPLYVGQHSIFKMLQAVQIRNGFKGCFRSLQINGVVPEIIESDLNEFAKLGSCSKVKVV